MTGIGERDGVPRLGAVAPLQPGDPGRVGRYVLSGRLGAGGMGTVYLGRAGGDGPRVAVKVVHAELAEDPEFRARFAGEVAAARRVDPFCTARVVDADPRATPPYLVTEFVDGVPLGTAVGESGPLDPSTLHGVALGVAVALAAVHAAGVVHRDLKPANVLLSLSGPRVIDFGIARALDAQREHTRTGMLVGTPGWMAPEQFRGGGVGPASDVFSWGSLIAYAATGRNPWEAAGASAAGAAAPSPPPAELAYRIVHGAPDLTGLTGPLRRLVEWALAKDPARRPTARQLVDELLGDRSMRGVRSAADPTIDATRFVERTWTGGRREPAAAGGAPPWAAPAPRTPSASPVAAGHGRPAAAPAGPGAPRSGPGGSGPAAPSAAFPPVPTPVPTAGRTRLAAAAARLRATAGRLDRVTRPGARTAARTAPRTEGRAASVPRTVAPPAAAPPTRVAPPAAAPPTRVAPPPTRVAPPQPTRPRRRWWRRKRIVLVPLLLLAIFALLPDPAARRSQAPQQGSQLGQPVRDGQLEFVVRDVRCGIDQLGEGALSSRPDGQYCLARMSVTNVKDRSRRLYEPVEKLVDSAGTKHSAVFTARFYFPGQTLWDDIPPGTTVSGTMVFDIPRDAGPDRLELHDGIASGGVTVRLR